MVLAVAIGTLSTAFIKLMLFTRQVIRVSLSVRLLIAGILTGIVAIFYPQVMGTGYDTITATFHGNIELSLLIAILIAKIILTPIILGLGIPAGLIGPSLFIGAVAGAIFGAAGGLFVDVSVSHIGMYAMLGMGAMMAAVLNAPLAALIALLELTNNHNIIFPGMIAIVCANLTTRYIFKTPSAFLALLQDQGLDYRLEPLAQILTRVSVAKVMSQSFKITTDQISLLQAKKILDRQTMWVVTQHKEQYNSVFPSSNISSFLARDLISDDQKIDLLRIPAQRFPIYNIPLKATLHQALQLMNSENIDLLCVLDYNETLIGILSRVQIEHYYTSKQSQ